MSVGGLGKIKGPVTDSVKAIQASGVLEWDFQLLYYEMQFIISWARMVCCVGGFLACGVMGLRCASFPLCSRMVASLPIRVGGVQAGICWPGGEYGPGSAWAGRGES